jgi:gamma-glutamylputrescine oxidase
VLALHPQGDGWRLDTARGPLRAGTVLAATGGYGPGLMPAVDPHVLPMQNYVAATSPLPPDLARSLIADDMAVSDSRFVVYYYRMSADHRLIFGGGESYSQRFPRDIAGFVRRHLARVFPQLAEVPLEFAWGGTLSITPNRLPYAREVAPGLFSLSGFSGLGVALGPWLGAGVADAMRGAPGLAWDCLQRLPAPRFPGGAWLRRPTLAAAMTYTLRDRI